MSAIGPDEHSSTQYSEASEQHNTPENGSEYELNYEPEREFVLMPLFRRIGEMLGLRRSPKAEYVYEPEQSTARQPAHRISEPQEEVVLPETAIQYSEPQLPSEAQVLNESALPDQSRREDLTRNQEEDVLQIEAPNPQHTSDNVVHESFKELQDEHPEPIVVEAEPGFTTPADETVEEPLVAARSEVPEMEPYRSVVEEWPLPAQPARPAPTRKRSPEEVRQLVAPLREAAVKITAIVAQAAEWLRAKEEEFLRSAETIAAESKREQQSLRSSSEQGDSIAAREPLPVPIQFVAKPDRPLAAPSVPFWKRVNWAEEFTPKRVAVLGGLAMAILLVLGISFARRPASSVLPEQQTRSLEPGGVTVTTHPVAAPVPPQVLRKASATERPSPVHRSPRAAADDYDDGPDVIIHHYDTAKKPSPVKQTTVAGVRHYSDM